jgi:cell division septum initiation protein DivIVA
MINVTSPAAIAAASFPTSRKGFDPEAVRQLLREVADELRRLQDERDRLAAQLDAARAAPETPALDEATVAELLGEETASVLRSAHEAAAQVRTRADDSAAQRLREAEDEVARVRGQAEVEAARLRQDANVRAQELKDAALREGREMVNEARAVRERIFADLARRRDLARQQIEQLLAERERLEQVFLDARSSVDAVLDDLAELGPPPEAPESVFTPPPTGEVPTVVLGEVDAPTFAAAAARIESDVDETMSRHPTHHRPEAGELDDWSEGDELGEGGAPEGGEPVDAADVPGFETDAEPEPEAGLAETDEEPDGGDEAETGADATPTDEQESLADRPTVDDLFARLRAAGTAEVAEEVLGEEAERPVSVPAGRPHALTAVPDHPVERFEQRKDVLEPVRASLARQLKRVLADEQNEALDRLRRAKVLPSLTDLLGAESDHAQRYRDAAAEQLRIAALAGVDSLGPHGADQAATILDGTNAIDRSLSEIDTEIVQPLRQRVAATLSSAADDPAEAAGLLRAVYREWKVDRLDGASEHLALAAHGRGAFVALAPGTPVCWVADPEGPGCPDAEDNFLAGAVAAGDEFPTGHRHAPAYPGCRCLLALVQS